MASLATPVTPTAAEIRRAYSTAHKQAFSRDEDKILTAIIRLSEAGRTWCQFRQRDFRNISERSANRTIAALYLRGEIDKRAGERRFNPRAGRWRAEPNWYLWVSPDDIDQRRLVRAKARAEKAERAAARAARKAALEAEEAGEIVLAIYRQPGVIGTSSKIESFLPDSESVPAKQGASSRAAELPEADPMPPVPPLRSIDEQIAAVGPLRPVDEVARIARVAAKFRAERLRAQQSQDDLPGIRPGSAAVGTSLGTSNVTQQARVLAHFAAEAARQKRQQASAPPSMPPRNKPGLE